mmetsp:Transcript_37905/g.109298  ORF Transcript_37905/g.109298 Transcript_37905/m.109298 type:complete len:265 (+) Transcript_37905:128-922(+)
MQFCIQHNLNILQDVIAGQPRIHHRVAVKVLLILHFQVQALHLQRWLISTPATPAVLGVRMLQQQPDLDVQAPPVVEGVLPALRLRLVRMPRVPAHLRGEEEEAVDPDLQLGCLAQVHSVVEAPLSGGLVEPHPANGLRRDGLLLDMLMVGLPALRLSMLSGTLHDQVIELLQFPLQVLRPLWVAGPAAGEELRGHEGVLHKLADAIASPSVLGSLPLPVQYPLAVCSPGVLGCLLGDARPHLTRLFHGLAGEGHHPTTKQLRA